MMNIPKHFYGSIYGSEYVWQKNKKFLLTTMLEMFSIARKQAGREMIKCGQEKRWVDCFSFNCITRNRIKDHVQFFPGNYISKFNILFHYNISTSQGATTGKTTRCVCKNVYLDI